MQTTNLGPFGEVIRATGPMAKANPFRFSTKYQDDETDLLYYGYRYYSATAGDWLSRDPLEEEGGLNLYELCHNNSTCSFDPLGLEQNVFSYGFYFNYTKETIDALNRRIGRWGVSFAQWTSGTVMNMDFFFQWLSNTGDDIRVYTPDDRLTKLLRTSPGADYMRSDYALKGCPDTGRGTYPTMTGYRNVFFHWGWQNAAEWQIGGFDWTAHREGNTVMYTVRNYASWRSLLGEPTARGWVRKALGYVGLRGEPWTPWPLYERERVYLGGAIYQEFVWFEQVPCCKGK